MVNKVSRQRLAHLYTGPAKGKTTAAMGLGMRAAGRGWQVYMIQFMKNDADYGEVRTIEKLGNYKIRQFGRPEFVDRDNPDPEDIKEAEAGLSFAQEILDGGEYDLVILDEVVCAADFGLIPWHELIELVQNKPENVELVLTGRGAPQELMDGCDYVTIMQGGKHPFNQGVQAREGVEY